MFTVTSTAKKKLKEVLEEKTVNPTVAVRIIHSDAMPNRLALVLDKEKKGDQIVESREGYALLMWGREVMPYLHGMLLDYQETSGMGRFVITKVDSDA